jgi:hypothetical protein
MRWGILLLVALGGCKSSSSCTPATMCGGGRSYTLCNAGGPNGCFYHASDNSDFTCNSCGDCDAARTMAEAWCGTPTSPPDLGGEMCGMAATCPGGGQTFQFCTTTGATACRYLTSDGHSFACSSCSNCGDATGRVTSWCMSGPTDLAVTCDALGPADCYRCCYSQHATGFVIVQQAHSCICPLCPDCAGSLVCAQNAFPSTACETCSAQQQATGMPCVQYTQACARDADCMELLRCEQSCPKM